MAGYSGYSMSNNAVEAYEDGEKPLSKWTKQDILDQIEAEIGNSKRFKDIPLQTLKREFLKQSSWHHTSNYYNKTNFYVVDTDKAQDMEDDELENLISNKSTMKKTVEKPKEEIVNATYLVWSGTRNHPKATEETENGILQGNWFISDSGVKKSITAKGFRINKRL